MSSTDLAEKSNVSVLKKCAIVWLWLMLGGGVSSHRAVHEMQCNYITTSFAINFIVHCCTVQIARWSILEQDFSVAGGELSKLILDHKVHTYYNREYDICS